ncbi:anaphase-promoting complex subunit 10 isoform X2 [Onychomys torridus]|uniref:anaphase-promoting complex subunit 10 isoform X2 n=1 Tax=Onychomys torridus TaxID=38674 RepID=UPI00167F2A51|nr:anaphase-promoting complex subunit 10 isoform X2 [Onychomys torridus]
MTTPNKTPPGADPKQLERTATVREIGSQAVWSLSSCKPGFGVDQLRDDNLETYWQSDGSQPHLVNIQFRRKTTVKTLCIYADYKSDESYTPSKISVRVGNNFHNLQEIRNPVFSWGKQEKQMFFLLGRAVRMHQRSHSIHVQVSSSVSVGVTCKSMADSEAAVSLQSPSQRGVGVTLFGLNLVRYLTFVFLDFCLSPDLERQKFYILKI